MAASAQHLRRLLEAVVAVGSGLDLAPTLNRIVETAVELVGAHYGALGVLDDSRERLVEFHTVGIDPDQRRKIGDLPEGHGILGVLILDSTPLRLPDLAAHPHSYGFPPNHPPMASFLGVPILIRGQVYGNLYLTEKIRGAEFTDDDEELAIGLATAAGVAIENARLHERSADLARIEDRDRIARDLHDTVIQRLFATGLSLQGATALIHEDPHAAKLRVDAAVDDLDETVKQVRTAIFALEHAPSRSNGLREDILDLCRRATNTLRFAPQVSFIGSIEHVESPSVVADLLATLREALSNVARHAGAERVDVEVRVAGDELVLAVTDDGRGLPPAGEATTSGHGLHNMAARAAGHGGRLDLRHGPPQGTVLEWVVPLSD